MQQLFLFYFKLSDVNFRISILNARQFIEMKRKCFHKYDLKNKILKFNHGRECQNAKKVNAHGVLSLQCT